MNKSKARASRTRTAKRKSATKKKSSPKFNPSKKTVIKAIPIEEELIDPKKRK